MIKRVAIILIVLILAVGLVAPVFAAPGPPAAPDPLPGPIPGFFVIPKVPIPVPPDPTPIVIGQPGPGLDAWIGCASTNHCD